MTRGESHDNLRKYGGPGPSNRPPSGGAVPQREHFKLSAWFIRAQYQPPPRSVDTAACSAWPNNRRRKWNC